MTCVEKSAQGAWGWALVQTVITNIDGLLLLPMQNMQNDIIVEWLMALIIEWLRSSTCSCGRIHVVCDRSRKPYKWQLGWQCDCSPRFFTAFSVWGSMARLAALCHSSDATSSVCGYAWLPLKFQACTKLTNIMFLCIEGQKYYRHVYCSALSILICQHQPSRWAASAQVAYEHACMTHDITAEAKTWANKLQLQYMKHTNI